MKTDEKRDDTCTSKKNPKNLYRYYQYGYILTKEVQHRGTTCVLYDLRKIQVPSRATVPGTNLKLHTRSTVQYCTGTVLYKYHICNIAVYPYRKKQRVNIREIGL